MNNGNKTISCRAPGKLMISGEHAVMYGFPCVVTAINRYIEVTGQVIKNSPDVFDTGTVSDQRFVRSTVALFKKTFHVNKSVHLRTQSTIGMYGLGSSAATVVAAMRVLSEIFGIKMTKKKLFDLSLSVVLEIQQRASGFDIAASIYGKTLYFDGKTKKYNIIADRQLPLVIAFSGQKADTVSLIGKVAEIYQENQKSTKLLFRRIESVVEMIKIAIIDQNWKAVGDGMNTNFQLLRQLRVSTDRIDNLVHVALAAGAYGAKLSGAGGGDCIIAIIAEGKRSAIETALRSQKAEVLALTTSIEGETTL